MDTKMTRTTITLPEDLLYEMKRKSLTKRRSLKEVLAEGLRFYLRYSESGMLAKMQGGTNLTTLFGTWGKGKRGITDLKSLRDLKSDNKRDYYLNSLWKKFS